MRGIVILRRVATMTAYDSIERGAADGCEQRRPRRFTLTDMLVACVAVGVCAIATMTVVHRHRGLAHFGDGATCPSLPSCERFCEVYTKIMHEDGLSRSVQACTDKDLSDPSQLDWYNASVCRRTGQLQILQACKDTLHLDACQEPCKLFYGWYQDCFSPWCVDRRAECDRMSEVW